MVNEPNMEGGKIPLNEEPTNPEPEMAIQEPSESDTPQKPEGENPEPKSTDELKTALAQKKHWREKFEKLDKAQESEPKPSIPLSDDDWKNRTDFLLTNQSKNYSKAEFDHISIISKEKGVSLAVAAEQSADYINFNRDKVENSKKVPGSSSALGAGGKSDKDIGNMTDAEHEAYWKKMNEKKGTRI